MEKKKIYSQQAGNPVLFMWCLDYKRKTNMIDLVRRRERERERAERIKFKNQEASITVKI